jgi:transaldolase
VDIYLDSADVASWSLPAGCPPVQGVTTNPSLIHQAGLQVSLASYLRLLKSAGDHGLQALMLQLPSSDVAMALQWLAPLRECAAAAKLQLTIKLPCHADWLPCIQAMQQAGQAVLLTGLSNAVQLLWARSLQVAYVAPYVGRLTADGRDVWSLMQACVVVQNGADQHQPGPALLAASIKSPEVLARLIGLGAHAATLPPASLIAWSQDALTEAAMAQFARDASESQSHSP